MLRLDRSVPAEVLTALGSDVEAVTLELVDLSGSKSEATPGVAK